MYSGNNSAKIIRLIEVRVNEGHGTYNDPYRVTFQYWSLDGKKLAVYDEWSEDKLRLFTDKLKKSTHSYGGFADNRPIDSAIVLFPIEENKGVSKFTEAAAALAIERNISFTKAAADLLEQLMNLKDSKNDEPDQ